MILIGLGLFGFSNINYETIGLILYGQKHLKAPLNFMLSTYSITESITLRANKNPCTMYIVIIQ